MYPRLVNDHSDKASDSFQWSGNPESTFIHTPAGGLIRPWMSPPRLVHHPGDRSGEAGTYPGQRIKYVSVEYISYANSVVLFSR